NGLHLEAEFDAVAADHPGCIVLQRIRREYAFLSGKQVERLAEKRSRFFEKEVRTFLLIDDPQRHAVEPAPELVHELSRWVGAPRKRQQDRVAPLLDGRLGREPVAYGEELHQRARQLWAILRRAVPVERPEEMIARRMDVVDPRAQVLALQIVRYKKRIT